MNLVIEMGLGTAMLNSGQECYIIKDCFILR